MSFIQNSKLGALQVTPSEQHGLHVLDTDIFYYFDESVTSGTLERLRSSLAAKKLLTNPDGSMKEVAILKMSEAKKAKLTFQPIFLSKLAKKVSELNEPKSEKVSW